MFVRSLRGITVGVGENKEDRSAYFAEYKKRPHVIEKRKKRQAERLGKRNDYFKEYWHRPEVQERNYARVRTPEYRAKSRERAMTPEVKDRTRWANIMRNYGLCKEDFERILAEQEGKCVICGFEFTEECKSTRPHVDHCHDSGEVRGLLCGNCNAGLGQFKDDTQKLQSAIEYLT